MKQNVIDDYNLLSGQQKAAILMLSLDEERSSALFSLMDDEEIKELSVIMASLGKVNSNIMEQLIAEFNEKISSTGNLVGTYESTERLLAKALDKDRVSVIMEEIRGPAGRTMWDKLGNVNEHVLANYLKNEYPQTIAVILSKIKAEHSAKVLALFPENFAMEIVMRMLRMDSVQKEVLDSLEKTLRKEFMSTLSKSTRRDAHELIAEIFNSLDRNTEGRFMEALDVDDMIAHLLIAEGFTTVDEIAEVELSELSEIEGFDEDIASEIQRRAKEFVEKRNAEFQKKSKDLGISDELKTVDGLDQDMIIKLAENNIKTLDDLADLASDELIEILGENALTETEANRVIMAAREHWFEDEEK